MRSIALLLLFIACKPAAAFTNRYTTMNENKICLSESTYDTVYAYLSTEIKNENLSFYMYKGYEFYIGTLNQISVRKDGYTMSNIHREKGISALAKEKTYNKIDVSLTHQLFCELYEEAIKQKK